MSNIDYFDSLHREISFFYSPGISKRVAGILLDRTGAPGISPGFVTNHRKEFQD